jgi:O-acetyl-ADP-ribose deacetylase (regulator of RNase III)
VHHQTKKRAIRYAEFLRLKSIAFPVLGSPQSKIPYTFIAHEMICAINQYFQRRNTKLEAIMFSLYNNDAFEAFRKEAEQITTPLI